MQKPITFFLYFFLTINIFSQNSDLPDLTADSAVLLDFSTGKILFNKNGETAIPPASMAKVMTLYLAYRYMEDNNLDPETVIEISPAGSAFSRPAGSSLMGLEEGQRVTYLELMKGVAIASGNDAAYALAQYISGSSQDFVNEMNTVSMELGFREFTFVDPDGWSEDNFITAESYARFCRLYIQTFPRALEELHSVRSLTHPRRDQIPAGARIVTPRTKKNTNILLGKVKGVDGLKTGYIPESGFNFTATALRNYTRFIAVIMGVHRNSFYEGLRDRAREAQALLEYGYSNFITYIFRSRNNTIKVKVWKGESDFVELSPVDDFKDTIPMNDQHEVIAVYHTSSVIKAPLVQGQILGKVSLIGEEVLYTSDLTAVESLEIGPFTKRLKDSIKLLLKMFR